MNEQTVMPAFAFERHRHIELEGGFILAGQLIVDIPKQAKIEGHNERMIATVVQQLTSAARSGSIPESGLVVGWHGGSRPPNAVDVNNSEIMRAWAINSVGICVRVAPRNDGFIRIDSETQE